MLSESTLLRLETQLEVIPMLLGVVTPEALRARTASGKWSAHENLAHLARHHAVFLERLNRILAENAPQLDRYRAEEDSAWPEWSGLSTEEVLSRLRDLRVEIIRLIKGLSEDEASQVGIHPLFGEMGVSLWVEFFLLHEAHHLYMVMIRLGEANRRLAPTL
jgi:DinB family protein